MTTPHAPRIRLFLDANVLISAAWKDNSKVTRLWKISNVELMTSNYVLAECTRNLRTDEQRDRLSRLLLAVRVMDFSETPVLDPSPLLPDKDQPVLTAAILSKADFLVTGDRKHFGLWFGTSVFGLRVEPPARFPEVLKES